VLLAGELLVSAGCVRPEYVDGMLAREGTMSTYLGNGVAMPHGDFGARDQVLRMGICVLQYPDGIVWGPDELATLVVGLAATEEEHITVLMNLAEVIEDEATARLLATTDDVAVIVERLTRPVEDLDDDPE
jgi:mannitol/fructose-specific phosphotransferase system IIA component